jgi:hypothetical protein
MRFMKKKWCKGKLKYKSKNKTQKPKQNLERLTLGVFLLSSIKGIIGGIFP